MPGQPTQLEQSTKLCKTEIFREENCSALSKSTDVDQVHRLAAISSAQPFLHPDSSKAAVYFFSELRRVKKKKDKKFVDSFFGSINGVLFGTGVDRYL